MPETTAFLVERLKAEGEKTAAFFSALTDGQWALPVYSEGETWTVRSMLAHYVSAEREMLRLFADIQNGGHGAAEDFSLDGYNASQQKMMAEISPQELLEHFGAGRAETIAFVSGLDEADLEKQGRHPYLGMMALGDMIKVVFRHNRLHERELRDVLSAA